VTVCRGCCCGTERKHPDADHAGQLDALLAGIGDAGRVRVSDCLDACEYSNVVVVGPSADARRVGARPVWIAGVLDRRAIADIVAWVRGGGPGLAHPSDVLDLMLFTRPGRPAGCSAARTDEAELHSSVDAEPGSRCESDTVLATVTRELAPRTRH
jgi:(2Fe-2S) ferredoxin